jgi:hypothetical protein
MFIGRDQGAHHGEFVPHAGLHGKVLANLHAGNVGLDRLELAAELGRRVGLEVVHIHVRRTAGQVDHDGRLRPGRLRAILVLARVRVKAKQVGERQPRAKRAHLEKASTADAIAELLAISVERDHDRRDLSEKRQSLGWEQTSRQ